MIQVELLLRPHRLAAERARRPLRLRSRSHQPLVLGAETTLSRRQLHEQTPTFANEQPNRGVVGTASWLWPLQFLAGWFLWTLYEYILHRWALHKWPIGREIHGLHHADQRDYIAIHPLATITIYTAVWLLFGLSASGFAVGISVGYIVYAVLHSAFHYLDIGPEHPLFASRRRHALHHSFSSVNFGVTHPLWDRLFRTFRK